MDKVPLAFEIGDFAALGNGGTLIWRNMGEPN
jgi:hypothetical protein